MHRKTFRYGVLALLLAATLTPAISATPASRSPRREVEQGFLAGAWELFAGLFGSHGAETGRGLRHLSGANREGIDPNGLTAPINPGSTNDAGGGTPVDPNG